MEFSAGISKNSYEEHCRTKENHTGMKERALMQLRTDDTYEFQFRLISTKHKYPSRYYHPDLL